MIVKLHNKVAEYMNKVSNMELWEDIRKKYFEYSYLAFMSICAHEIKYACVAGDVEKIICDNEIVEEEIVSHIFKLPSALKFITEILSIVNEYQGINLNSLYQNYLATDFLLVDGKVKFEGGKNNRDILGSYYTQEEFAYEITKKAIEEYIGNINLDETKMIKIADYSCGGGAFLIAACRICNEKGINADLYGYDVDPIAIMITRFRLMLEESLSIRRINIMLGNPLLLSNNNMKIKEKFALAEIGRFYALEMGTVPEPNMSVIVGNPPWEKIRFEEKKFLMHYVENQEIGTKVGREEYIQGISEDNKKFYNIFINDYERAKQLIKNEENFRESSCGELNTYALFTELCRNSVSVNGIVGLIVKSSLLKMPVYSKFFRNMTKNMDLYEIYIFVNRNKIFNIDSREEFSVIYLKKNNKKKLKIALNLDSFENFSSKEKLELSHDLLNKLNPDTGMLPNISNLSELEFLVSAYEKHNTFGKVFPDCKYGRLVHLTNHSESIKKCSENGFVPIYEGKFIELYTGKYATFSRVEENDKYKNKASARNILDIDGDEYPEARFYIKEEVWRKLSKNFENSYVIAWRSLTSATNRRTMLATILPLLPTCQSIQILQMPKKEMLHVIAIFNSVVFDYIVRLKMVGLDLTQTIVKQIPIPDAKVFDNQLCFMGKTASVEEHINSRIRILYSTDERLDDLFSDINIYSIKGNISRKQIIAEIDSLIAFAYGISKDEFKNILHSFNKFYTKEEVEYFF